jgi:hypothetical protein
MIIVVTLFWSGLLDVDLFADSRACVPIILTISLLIINALSPIGNRIDL